jgi:hypothetical protein
MFILCVTMGLFTFGNALFSAAEKLERERGYRPRR